MPKVALRTQSVSAVQKHLCAGVCTNPPKYSSQSEFVSPSMHASVPGASYVVGPRRQSHLPKVIGSGIYMARFRTFFRGCVPVVKEPALHQDLSLSRRSRVRFPATPFFQFSLPVTDRYLIYLQMIRADRAQKVNGQKRHKGMSIHALFASPVGGA